MTGTANEFCEYSESNNMDLFSAWLYGKINANCLLSDLSRSGCSVLIPEKQSAPSGVFNLLIMSPEDSGRLHTILKGELRWQDVDYSATHKKLGIKFREPGQEQLSGIDVLSQYFRLPGNTVIKCSLLKHR